MPTYEYRCKDCDHEFEVFQSIKDDPVDTCPACGGEAKKRPSGGAGLIFKGSGFYITDYKNKKPESSDKKEAKSDSGKSSTESASKTKSEKKKDTEK